MDVPIYTCITCRVAFPDADLQRGHYKTDWHRYNLKRKVADMPPVTAENFQKRVLAQRAEVEEQGKKTSGHCQLCNKHFGTKNTFDSHLRSKKHKEAEAREIRRQELEVARKNKRNQEKGVEDAKETEKNQVKESLNEAEPSGSGTKPKVTATSRLDEVETLDDDEEMDSDCASEESWDGEALGEEECLFCSYISDSLETNIEHMTIKHSFFIPDIEYMVDLPGLITYLGQKVGEGHVCLWCNEKGKMFSTTKAVQQHMLDKGHCKLLHEGEVVFEYADFYDYRSSYPDQEHGDENDVDMEEGATAGEEVEPDVLDPSGFQLMLPSGSMVGHRSLHRYYKQRLTPETAIVRTSVPKVISRYKALGWTGTTGPAAAKRAKDVAFIQRVRHKQYMKLGMKHNNQKHFRDPNMQ